MENILADAVEQFNSIAFGRMRQMCFFINFPTHTASRETEKERKKNFQILIESQTFCYEVIKNV